MKFLGSQKKLGVALILLCAVQYFAYTDFDSLDSSSVARNGGRSTELGKPVPTKNKPEKEVEVLLNDPAISAGWGLKMTDAAKAWRISQGSRDIVVCVIDTGADIHHPDLINNLWVNTAEVARLAQVVTQALIEFLHHLVGVALQLFGAVLSELGHRGLRRIPVTRPILIEIGRRRRKPA